MTKEEWEIVTNSWKKLESCYKVNRKIDSALWFVSGVFLGMILTQILLVV